MVKDGPLCSHQNLGCWAMTEEILNTAYLEKRLGVFDDSQEISDMLSGMDCYVTHEGAAHIDGLYVLAQEMMKHIKKLERKK